MRTLPDIMREYATAVAEGEQQSQEELLAEAKKLTQPHTYYFAFSEDARLVVVQSNMPMEDAVHRTGETIKLFGWKEGIMRAISEIESYIKTGRLNALIDRIKLNAAPVETPSGVTYEGCAACGFSAAAEQAMWLAVIAALDKELESPPGQNIIAKASE